MTRRFVRLTLFAVLLLALGAATYRIALLERSRVAEAARTDGSTRAAAGALDALLELRAVERAYIAEGQGVPYWRGRAQDAETRLKRDLGALQEALGPTPASTALETADETLTRLVRLEDRIAEHAAMGRKAHAEDLVYADALDASTTLERDLRTATAMLHEQSRQRARDFREQELIVVGLTASVALLVGLLLVPVGRDHKAVAATAAGSEQTDAEDLPLNRRDAPQLSSGTQTAALAMATGPRPAAGHARSQERAAMAKLHATADLCGALGRVRHSRDLPGLLTHIGRVLDAQGTIVWVANASARTLSPALSHGYRQETLDRLGAIGWDAQNPAAEAYRRGEAGMIDPVKDAPGAFVVPLLAASGCVGVLTLELQSGARPDMVTLDLARLFAAQLASLITPAPPAEESISEAGEPPPPPESAEDTESDPDSRQIKRIRV